MYPEDNSLTGASGTPPDAEALVDGKAIGGRRNRKKKSEEYKNNNSNDVHDKD